MRATSIHRTVLEVFWALYLLAQIAVVSALIVMLMQRSCAPEAPAVSRVASPAVYVSDEALDAVGARLIAAQATVRRWEDLAERRERAQPVVCEQLAMHVQGLPQEVR